MGRRGEPCGDREIGVTQPQAKECLKLPEARRERLEQILPDCPQKEPTVLLTS